MANKFKKGDKVRVLPGQGYNGTRYSLIENGIYTVTSTHDEDLRYPTIMVDGIPSGWYEARFELVEEAVHTPEKCIEVLKGLGYTITEPPKKLSGKVYILKGKHNGVVTSVIESAYTSTNYYKEYYDIVTIVDWEEDA